MHPLFSVGQALTKYFTVQDVYAMGGKPKTALAIVVVPFSTDTKMEEDLKQLMQGVTDTLEHESCRLIGGHSCEGPDIALGEDCCEPKPLTASGLML